MPRSGTLEPGAIVGGHTIEALLGQGGSGEVYRAFGPTNRDRVALKLLPKAHADQHPALFTAFQREFYRLEQLRHPRIIEVYEYGADKAGLYYTMELLTGEGLREMAPVPWRRACELLRDVALSLAVMHSRRLLHRDVSPGNVRCTSDGRAKLIDFGATTTIGVPSNVVGTPQCMPPEALRREALDARSDLYGLGALGYWLVTGRHAYPAHTFAQLEYAWKTLPSPPSTIATGVPASLDQLLVALLRHDVNARPASAMEVINRLEAIAGLSPVEAVEATRASLVTPALTGRAAEVELLREHVRQAVEARGGSVLIEGEAGIGRSRLLGHLVLETGGAEVVVLHPSSTPAGTKRSGLMTAIGEEALRKLPEVSVAAAADGIDMLANLVPRLGAIAGVAPASPPDNPRTRAHVLQRAWHEWLLGISERCAIVVLVDDFHRCDEASAAAVAMLALSARNRRILVVVTRSSSSTVEAPHAVQTLARVATRLQLRPLDASAVESLIQSVFGRVPHLKHVAEWVYEVARGNPAQSVELVQCLVSRSIARYSDGTWTLPARLDGSNLPKDLSQAFDARVQSLSGGALAFAQLLRVFDRPLPLDLVVVLSEQSCDERRHAAVFSALDELVAAQVAQPQGDAYAFTHAGIAEAVERTIGAERRKALHQHIGNALAQRYARPRFEASHDVRDVYWASYGAFHLMLAGDEERGLDCLAPAMPFHLEVAHVPIWENNEWYVQADLLGLQIAERLERSNAKLRFWTSLVMCGIHTDHRFIRYAEPAFEQLKKETGIAHLETIAEKDRAKRLRKAIAKAFEHYEAKPEAERGLNPIEAIGELVRCAISAVNICSHTFDIPRLRSIRELLAELLPLNETMSVWVDVTDAAVEHCTGRVEREVELRKRVALGIGLDSMKRATLETARIHVHGFNLYPLAQLEAARNPAAGLERADQMERETPFMEYEAWQVRLLAHIHDGNTGEAQASSERLEMAAVQGGATKYQMQASGLQYLAEAYSLAGDLMGLKHTIERLAPLAEDAPVWAPFYDAARAHYFRLRGQLDEARRHAVAACAGVQVGEHRGWLFATTTLIHISLEGRQFEEAYHLAQHALREARFAELGPDAELRLLGLLASAEIAIDNCAAASQHADAALALANTVGQQGIARGLLHEVAARVALERGDAARFEAESLAMAKHCCAHDNAMLLNRHRDLLDSAIGHGLDFHREAAGARSERPSLKKIVAYELEQRGGGPAAVLRLMVDKSGALSGFLYRVRKGRLELAAPEAAEPPAGLTRVLADMVQDERGQSKSGMFDARTTTLTTVWKSPDNQVFQIVLLSVVRAGEIHTVGAMALSVRGEPPRIPKLEYLLALGELLESEDGAGGRARTIG